MDLHSFLSEKRSILIKKWRNQLIDTYPDDTQRFFRSEKDRFSNPVGYTLSEAVEGLFDELTNPENTGKVASLLDKIIRIRAVQDMKPSDAIGFVIQLKKIIRDELQGLTQSNGLSEGIQEIESKIDNMALLAFDVYTQCRQKIYEIRVNEVKNQVSGLLRRSNISIQSPDFEKKTESDN